MSSSYSQLKVEVFPSKKKRKLKENKREIIGINAFSTYHLFEKSIWLGPVVCIRRLRDRTVPFLVALSLRNAVFYHH